MPAPLSTNNLGFVIRPAAERFHSSHDWLDSWHSFSFAGHHHPDWMGFGPLRVINDDVIAAGRGFGMHPHRDMEIITVMIEGQLNHRDSMGNSGVINAGDVQRMSAGTGIVHSEMNEGHEACRLLQIWIEPSEEGLSPAYEQRTPNIGSDTWTPLLAPNDPSVMAIERPVSLWRTQPSAGQNLTWPVQSIELGWIQMIEGEIELPRPSATSIRLRKGDGLGFKGSSSDLKTLQSHNDSSDVLLFALE
jgi:redox-sensitive bicupin YhaK (pirin superfamily)